MAIHVLYQIIRLLWILIYWYSYLRKFASKKGIFSWAFSFSFSSKNINFPIHTHIQTHPMLLEEWIKVWFCIVEFCLCGRWKCGIKFIFVSHILDIKFNVRVDRHPLLLPSSPSTKEPLSYMAEAGQWKVFDLLVRKREWRRGANNSKKSLSHF